jgi:hypothetical protein
VTQPPSGPQHPDPSSPVPAPPGHGQAPGYGYAQSPPYGVGAGYDRPVGFDPGYGSADVPPAPAEDGIRTRRIRRRIAVGATVAGAVVIGGAGYAVAAYLSGGGAQPEEVLPADTLAFVKLDLDPAMGQKTAVAALMEKFPALGDGPDDIRQDLVDGLLEFGDTELSYAEDVDPWLGDRMAVAVVRDEASEPGFAVVFVLAVDDQQAMGDTLRTLGDDIGFSYAVRDDFLLLAEHQETADRLAAEESRLAENDQYVGDRAALDGDQIAVAWADLSAVQQLLGQVSDGDATLGLDESVGQLNGRVVFGLHAEDDALELVGMDFTVSDAGPGPRPTEPTRLVQDLPEDTLFAVSASGVGDMMVDRWDELEATGMVAPFQEMFPDLELPDDLRTVFGSDLLVAMRGDLEAPQVGLRAVTDDPERAIDILERLNDAFELHVPIAHANVDDGYALATDTATASALAGNDPGLGDSAAFRAAVPAADEATMVAYADLPALLDQFPESGDFRRSDYEALQALGVTSTNTDEGTRFVLRVTTR